MQTINFLQLSTQTLLDSRPVNSNLLTRCTRVKYEFHTTDGAPEQFGLQRFDTVPFCCVINKCQARTSDKLERCVHSVVLLCSIYRNLFRTKSILGR